MAIFVSFARYIFQTFTFMATIIILYYVAPQWQFIDTETDDQNDLELSFCVKIWFELDIQWVGVSGFRIKLFGNLQSYTHRLSAAKKYSPPYTGDINVIGLFAGVPLRGSVKPVNCIHTQFSDVLFTDIENK